MLSKQEALKKALEIYNEYRLPEQRRLDRIDEAIQPKTDDRGLPLPRIELPDDAPPILKQLTVESETNYLPLLLNTYAQVMRVDGYITKSSGRDPWDAWQRNRMDSRQTPLHRSTLAYGTAYASAFPGKADTGEEYPAARIYSPRKMTALYNDDEWDDWPVWALVVGETHWELLGQGEVHILGRERQAPTRGAMGMQMGNHFLTYVEPRENDLQVTPVVKYHDRHYMGGEKVLGIVEPLVTVQRRIDRTSANQMIAQQIAIFRQKYVVGWVPESEEEELKASLARVHYLDMDPNEVKLGEWEATDIEPYIKAGNQARRDFAALGQLPSQSLGIDGISNISDATLAGLEAAKNRNAGSITTSLGESHEQLMRLFATIDGNEEAAKDFASEVLWRDFESRSFQATVDGLLKLVSMGLPEDIAMEDVPGMSGQKLERIQKAMRRKAGRETLMALRNNSTNPPLAQPGAPTQPTANGTPPAAGATQPAQEGGVSGG